MNLSRWLWIPWVRGVLPPQNLLSTYFPKLSITIQWGKNTANGLGTMPRRVDLIDLQVMILMIICTVDDVCCK